MNNSLFYNFKDFLLVVYDGEPFGEYDVELPPLNKTIKLIDEIWQNNHSEFDDYFDFDFTDSEQRLIFETAQKEIKSFDRLDFINSHARYNTATNKQIKQSIKDYFNINVNINL